MSNTNSIRYAITFILLVITSSPLLLAQEAGESALKGVVTEDLYVAGGRVDVLAEIDGDVVAAGGKVAVGQKAKGDVMAAGGTVAITAEVGDDVRVVGGKVTLAGPIGDNAIAAGGSINLTPDATVGGRAWLAGAKVRVDGRIGRELRVSAWKIVLAGEVQGDVNLTGNSIEVLPTAQIKGNLTYQSSREADIASQARIEGTVLRQPRETSKPTLAQMTVVLMMIVASLAVAGIVLLLLFPRSLVVAAKTIETDPLKCLGLGFAMLVATPLVIVVLLTTVIGIPLALALFALYFIALLAGLLTGVLYLGEVGLRLSRLPLKGVRGKVLALIAALIGLALLSLIPVIGGIIVLTVLLFGIGALQLQRYRALALTQ